MRTIASSQPRLRGSAPLAKARRRVRTISRSLSASTNWLKAPALADATSTDSASTSACNAVAVPPGTTARPASAVIMISVPMRSLNTPSTVRQSAAAPAARDSAAGAAPLQTPEARMRLIGQPSALTRSGAIRGLR